MRERFCLSSLFCHINPSSAYWRNDYPVFFTLLSFSCSLGAFMVMSSMVLLLRAIGERWDVSLGGGVMWYWTLGVHLTEKNLDPAGAPLRNTNMQWIVYTWRAQHFNETWEVKTNICLHPSKETVAVSQGTTTSFLTSGGTIEAAWSVTCTGLCGFKQNKKKKR